MAFHGFSVNSQQISFRESGLVIQASAMPLDAEKRRKYLADYRAKNKERISAYLAEYRKTYKLPKGKSAEYTKAYRARHPERVAKYKAKNKSKMLDYCREWRAKNPDKMHQIGERAKIKAREKRALNRKPRMPLKTALEKRETAESYRKNNAEKLAAKNSKWRSENRERLALYFSEYAKKNKERKNEQNRLRYASSGSMLSYHRKYRKENPFKIRSFHQKRRALMKKAPIGCLRAIASLDKEVRSKPQNCRWCNRSISGSEIELDHIIALANGGAHDVGNLCISCKSCNSRKQDKSLAEWNEIVLNLVKQKL